MSPIASPKKVLFPSPLPLKTFSNVSKNWQNFFLSASTTFLFRKEEGGNTKKEGERKREGEKKSWNHPSASSDGFCIGRERRSFSLPLSHSVDILRCEGRKAQVVLLAFSAFSIEAKIFNIKHLL